MIVTYEELDHFINEFAQMYFEIFLNLYFVGTFPMLLRWLYWEKERFSD